MIERFEILQMLKFKNSLLFISLFNFKLYLCLSYLNVVKH